MRGKIILLFALLAVLPVLGIVSAVVDTTITIQSGAGHMITVSVLDSSSSNEIITFNETATDNYGKAVFTYTDSSSGKSIDVVVTARSNGKIIFPPKVFPKRTGDIIYIDLTATTSPTTNTTVTTVVNTTNTTVAVVNTTNTTSVTAITNTNSSTGPSILSRSLTSTKDFIVAKWIWIVGVIIAVIVIYVLIRLAPLIKSKIASMPRAPSPSVVEGRPKSRIESQLLEAERKIKQAQAEIDSLRNKESKVKDAERRFEEAKRELDRVKKY